MLTINITYFCKIENQFLKIYDKYFKNVITTQHQTDRSHKLTAQKISGKIIFIKAKLKKYVFVFIVDMLFSHEA